MDELQLAQPIIEGKLYFAALSRPDALRTSALAASSICYCIDSTLVYEPFFADFGPLNLGKTFRFCRQTSELLQEADRTKKRLYFYCGPHPNQRANGAVLMGIYQVIYLNRSAEEAYKPVQAFKPFVPFRDASCGVSTFHLTVFDVIKGIQKARDVGFLDWNSGCSAWSLEEYEHYEQVENGDLNWIVPGKLVAFSGPANRGNEIAGYRLHTPEDYWSYYKKRCVTAVVRLNKKVYDRQRFTQGGFRHYDLYFPDGSCPTEAILLKFLELAESEPGALAIHCKAGLGRTGVLICCYIMKHFKFTAEEVIGYIRVCRPGSVIGPQQNFLRDVEARMWHEGDMWRAARGINKPHLALGDLAISGRPVSQMPEMMAGSMTPSTPPPVSHHNSYGSYGRASPKSGTPTSNTSSNSIGLLITRPSGGTTSTIASSSSPFASAAASQARPRADGATLSNAGTGSDLSLLQYRQQQQQGFPTSLSVQVPPTPGLVSNGSTPLGSPLSTPTGSGSRNSTARYPNRSVTPLRYNLSSAYGSSAVASQGSIIGYSGARAATSNHASVTRSTPSPQLARAPSADRAFDRRDLRSTIHTDTLRAADRVRMVNDLERATLSADMSLACMVGSTPSGPSAPIPTTPKAAAPGHRPNAGVARTLAPNGQPRKVPMAMLTQYHTNAAGKQAATGIMSSPSTPVGGPGALSVPNTTDMSRVRTPTYLRN